ncbi:MAG: maleylpyruvate isomerase family mycothiol-dependent enzyme [Mycobacteriaceae bacterium]|nr:maleylpyruvate isomerase family mycothiol-dependent enzyme [Mycobacteriaceae bacterium]MBV9638330.1 maleylpyruvate isomerase family mycothiol-dependent enzyme [Mycobacteriaceae bacterium]
MTAMQMARQEREDLAALLTELLPAQWDMPTLCERWRVRDVVAHVISYDDLGRVQLARRFLAGGLSIDRINALGVADYARFSPAELLDAVRAHLQPRGLTAGLGGMIALVDGMIHQQDIRRSLGIDRAIPPDRLRAALDFARYAPLIRGAWYARGLRLVATDVDWSHGRGPDVRGGGEALLMAMAGRKAALDDLTGPGQHRLARQL